MRGHMQYQKTDGTWVDLGEGEIDISRPEGEDHVLQRPLLYSERPSVSFTMPYHDAMWALYGIRPKETRWQRLKNWANRLRLVTWLRTHSRRRR